MTAYAECSLYVQGLTAFFYFLVVVQCLCSLFVIFSKSHKQRITTKLMSVFLLVLNFLILTALYNQSILEGSFGNTESLPLKLSEQPIILLLALPVFTMLYLSYFLRQERDYRNTEITDSSIKEAVDHLSSGLCLATPQGRVMMCNYRMQMLCGTIMEESLQDANLFWQAVTSEGIEYDENHAEIMLRDGSIWSFTRRRYQSKNRWVVRIVAADVTNLHSLSVELRKNRQALIEVNRRLHQYEQQVDVLTRDTERMNVKVKIHGTFGQILLATKYAVEEENSKTGRELTALNSLIEEWKAHIAIFKSGEEKEEKSNVWEELLLGAQAVGLRVNKIGELPKEQECLSLLMAAAAEALTNAVRHAQAQTVTIEIKKKKNSYELIFTNDGNKPEGEIIPGGGLSSLKKRLEAVNGSIELYTAPEFRMIITIPCTGGNNGNNPGFNRGR